MNQQGLERKKYKLILSNSDFLQKKSNIQIYAKETHRNWWDYINNSEMFQQRRKENIKNVKVCIQITMIPKVKSTRVRVDHVFKSLM